ncbi:MAG: hypothetical protein DMF61_02010 [Blastocatellia bacterium AA13]|nr:MAG: hypothetical protein DMF61_02010 [Blastocatellia bacterium AA13]
MPGQSSMLMLNIAFSQSRDALTANPLRTVLTTIGISVGVAAMVAMSIMLDGISSLVLSEVQGLGAGSFYILPVVTNNLRMRPPRFTETDFRFIREEIQDQVEVFSLSVQTQDVVIYGSKRIPATVMGASPELRLAQQYEIASGRFIVPDDLTWRRNVCVIGSAIAKDLGLDGGKALARLRIRNRDMQVVGCLAPRGQRFGTDLDRVVLIPIDAMRTIYSLSDQLSAMGRAKRPEDLQRVTALVERRLRDAHRLRRDEENDFKVMTQTEILDRLDKLRRAVGLIGAAVTGVALLVGGIGIMNISLFTTVERTPEIGLRRSIGATRRQVLAQFLVESVLLALCGGLTGVIIGNLSGWMLTLMAGVPFIFSPSAIALGFGAAAATGIIFGAYPAKRAASITPMVALQRQ